MRKIKGCLASEVRRKTSHERLAESLGISKGVVTKYVTLAGAAKLD